MKFLLISLFLGSPALAEDISQKILELRAQVEEAGTALEESRKKKAASFDLVLQRQTEIEQGIRKERLKSLQLAEKRKLLVNSKVSLPREGNKELLVWAAELKKIVMGGLPFRVEERVAAISQLEDRIQKNRESHVTLASELWNLTDRELKLAASNEYRMGKVSLPSGEKEAEVARIGSLQALFRSSTGELGFAQRVGKVWKWQTADGEQAKAIDRLISRFQEKSYTGWFELPGLEKGIAL